MSLEIGSVEIPIVYEILPSEEAEVDEISTHNIDNVVVKHESELPTLSISGYLNEHLHSSNDSLETQHNSVKSLRTNDVVDNSIDYKEWKGHLLIQNIDVTKSGSVRIVDEVDITAKYFPWPAFYPGDEP